MTRISPALVCVALLTTSVSCTSEADPGDGGADGGGDPRLDAGRGLPDATADATMCFADPPCRGRFECAGATAYRTVDTRDCHHACGPGPCSGAVCVASGPVTSCPTGEVCVSHFVPDRACGPPGTGEDASIDAGVDAGSDAGEDSGMDGGP